MHKILRYGFIGILFPILVQYVFYYQFTTNYTKDAFSEEGFNKIYDTKVYKSRLLGKKIHLFIYHQLASKPSMQKLSASKNDEGNPLGSARLTKMDPQADPVFYLSYFITAVIFTILTALVLLFLFDNKKLFASAFHHHDLATCFIILMIGFTQFVVTPYDNVGYFLQVLGITFFLHYFLTKKTVSFILFCALIVIATLNRETSLLLLSFMAAVFTFTEGIRFRWIRIAIIPSLCFLATYLYLKLAQDGGADFVDQNQLAVNLDPRNTYAIRGLAFEAFVLYFVFVTMNIRQSRLPLYFLLFALPYIAIIHAVGVMVEYRLWMPVLIGAVICGLMTINKHTLQHQNF